MHTWLQDHLPVLETADAAFRPVLEFIVHVAQSFGELLLQAMQVVVAEHRELARKAPQTLKFSPEAFRLCSCLSCFRRESSDVLLRDSSQLNVSICSTFEL
jgi:hypothetical protein